jgi:hypothetical protein
VAGAARALPSPGLLAIYGRVSRVPPQPSGGKDLRPGAEPEELEQLEELGDDAIIAQQQGAHVPKPRAQVTEEARSVVISDHPPQGSSPPPVQAPAESKRRERQEQTVVIRDRRKIDELRKEMELRKQRMMAAQAAGPGVWIWVVVGLAAFLMGGLVALFATREDESGVAPIPSAALQAPAPTPVTTESVEPPSVSIDELPVEGSKKPK